jgi:hypothetical protein
VQNHTSSSWSTCLCPTVRNSSTIQIQTFAGDVPLFFALWRERGQSIAVQWHGVAWRDVTWLSVTRLAAVHALALSFGYEPECYAWRALHYILFSHKIIARLRVFQVLNHDNNYRNMGSVFSNDLTSRRPRFVVTCTALEQIDSQRVKCCPNDLGFIPRDELQTSY